MAKRPSQLNLKPPGKCIFCGQGNLSKEHIWSEWTHALIGVNTATNRVEAGWKTSPRDGTRLTRRKERPGHTATKKLRVVCVKCNNEWMSTVDNTARDCLTPLILGAIINLDVFGQNIVAIWAALKTLTIEHNTKENVITSQSTRDAFRDKRTIPDGMKISIAQCGQSEWRSALIWETHTIAVADTLEAAKLQRPSGPNIQAVSFGIGQLFIHVVHTTAPGVDFTMKTNQQGLIFQIFPIVDPVIHWPPRRALTVAEARSVAMTIDRLKFDPRFRWVE
jgi:hypothetical protein